MFAHPIHTGPMQRILCVVLVLAIAPGSTTSVFAQTNAAAMAVRQRAEGLQGGPEGGQAPTSSPEGPPPAQPGFAGPAAGKLDTRYVSPNAAIVAVLRPSQILASPIAQVFPIEVVSAAGLKFLGFDPTQMEEVIAFSGPFNPAALAYGVTIKFKNPIRASSIPPERRAHAQLAELGGKKYLKSSMPMMYSLYGPDNKTLVLATDPALHELVETAGQPKSGPMMERLRDVPSGSDLYWAIDLASFRPFIQMGLAQAQAKAPPEAKPYMELPNLIAAAELTLNLSAPAPSSFVIHCNDEPAAQKVESLLQEAIQKARSAQQAAQPAGDDPIGQGMTRYTERMAQPFQPQRNGKSVTCFHLDGQNPGQQQLLTVGIIGAALAGVGLRASYSGNGQMGTGQNFAGPPAAIGPSETSADKPGELAIGPELRSRLVGRYQLKPDFIFDVNDRDGHLMVGITNQATQEVFPESPTRWSYHGVEAKLEFKLAKTGPAQSLVLLQNGAEQTAQRIK